MEIRFSFDDNEISADEPLGSVVISHNGESIHAPTVFLDSFFAGLVRAYEDAVAEGEGLGEVAEEHDSIVVQQRGQGLAVIFGNSTVAANRAQEFEKALKAACGNLLRALSPDGERNPILDPVRAFVKAA
jgi:hypothetical protein